MKKILCWLVLYAFFSGAAGLSAAGGETAPAENRGTGAVSGEKGETKAVVARVNGVDLSLEALIRMEGLIRSQKEQAAKAGHQDAGNGDIWGEAMDRLIFQELMYQKARALGMKADEKDIDNAIQGLKKNLGGEQEYKLFLEKEGTTESALREELERGRLLKALYTREVDDKVVVTGEDLRAEYEREKRKFTIPEKIVLTDVVFFLDINDKKSLEKAEEVLGKILADAGGDPSKLPPDPAYIVREHTVTEGETALREEAKKLKEGDVSGVIKTPDSIHIIKLMQYSAEKQFPFDEVKGMIEKNLRAQARQKRAAEWKEELKKSAKIEILSPAGPAGEKGK